MKKSGFRVRGLCALIAVMGLICSSCPGAQGTVNSLDNYSGSGSSGGGGSGGNTGGGGGGGYIPPKLTTPTAPVSPPAVERPSVPIPIVTVSPPTVVVQAGKQQTFTAQVNGVGNSSVVWIISSTGHAGTTRISGGILTVAANEKKGSITVTASYGGGTGRATVTVQPQAEIEGTVPGWEDGADDAIDGK